MRAFRAATFGEHGGGNDKLLAASKIPFFFFPFFFRKKETTKYREDKGRKMSFNRVISAALLANFHRRFRSPFSNIKIIPLDRNNITYEHVRGGKYTSLLGEITATDVSMGCREPPLWKDSTRCSSRLDLLAIGVHPSKSIRRIQFVILIGFFSKLGQQPNERDREIRYRHRPFRYEQTYGGEGEHGLARNDRMPVESAAGHERASPLSTGYLE